MSSKPALKQGFMVRDWILGFKAADLIGLDNPSPEILVTSVTFLLSTKYGTN
jgi:hypothetical protein